jgi:hypothetical protein
MKPVHGRTSVDPGLLEASPAVEVISSIVESAVKRYRVDTVTAADIVTGTISEYPAFLEYLQREMPVKNIMKTRLYDEVKTKSKRKIYYALRQYNKDREERETLTAELRSLQSAGHSVSGFSEETPRIVSHLARTHVSTRERMESPGSFYSRIFDYIDPPESIVDVGCGLNPLIFPFDREGSRVACYAALEKDTTCISALEVFSGLFERKILHPFQWDIKDGWKTLCRGIGVHRFQIAFLMKLVPVVSRLERRLLDILLDTPADTWVVTGSRTSMTKHIDIEKRERKIVRAFLSQSGKGVAAEFVTSDEFCFIAK